MWSWPPPGCALARWRRLSRRWSRSWSWHRAARTETLVQELAAVRAELAQPVFRSSAQARDVDERIEEFGRETIAVGLHSFPGGVG